MSAKTLADVAEAVRRHGLAFLPPSLVRSALVSDGVYIAMRHDKAVARVYALSAIVGADPAEIISAANGDTVALEEWAHDVARTGSVPTLSALSSLASELADA